MPAHKPTFTQGFRQIAPALITAGVGGYTLQRLGLPVGYLVGSMTATAAHNLISSSPWRLPRGFRKSGEFLLGVTIGSMFTLAVAQFLLDHMLPVFISVGGALLSGLVCGYFLLSQTDLDQSRRSMQPPQAVRLRCPVSPKPREGMNVWLPRTTRFALV